MPAEKVKLSWLAGRGDEVPGMLRSVLLLSYFFPMSCGYFINGLYCR